MKKTIYLIIFCIIFLINIGLVIHSVKQNNELNECEVNNCKTQEQNNQENIKEVDCTFTRTYNIVNLMENYIAEVPEYSYVIVDSFQSHGAIAHFLPTNLKSNLKIGESYEFVYHLKGKGNIEEINDIYDVINRIIDKHPDNGNLTATLTINKTDKLGLEQLQEPICIFK